MLVASGLAADASEPAANAAPEKFTYIVVLHDRAPKDGSPAPQEPDIPALGGELLHQWRNRRVIRMPEPAVRALVAHRGVKYIQRVQTDGNRPGPTRSESLASAAVVEANWAPPTWFSGEYVYDGDGNITQIGTAASPSSDGGGDSYAYDSAGRLVSVVADHGTEHSEQYTYDSFGNLVNTTRTSGPSTATPTSTASNRLENATYDSVGNVIATEGGAAEYFYDGLNMMRLKGTSTGAGWYIYTASDERIGVQENGETRWMIRDLQGRVLREWEGNSGWWLWVEDYVHRGSVLAAAERELAEGGTRHFHVDHLGTARLLTDSDRNKIALHDYFPFGVERTDFRQEMLERGTDRPEPMKFTGHERDFTGGIETDNRNQLDYMHARYYSPVWGRFLSVDPVLDVRRALKSPQMWNRYSYVMNNPINRIDPDGRLVRLVGTDEERKKAFELIQANLREQDRKYVTMNKNGVLSVDAKAKGGVGLGMLRDLARKDKPTVNVSLGLTATVKSAPGPSPTSVIDLQAAAGGGVTLRPWQAMSGTFEVHVDPRGSLQFGASASLVMGHELLGHAWDLMFKGTSSERSAVTTETNLLLQLGLPQFRPVPTDDERP